MWWLGTSYICYIWPYLSVLCQNFWLLIATMPYQVKQDFKNTMNISNIFVNITDILRARRAVYSTLLDINFVLAIIKIDWLWHVPSNLIKKNHATEFVRIEEKISQAHLRRPLLRTRSNSYGEFPTNNNLAKDNNSDQCFSQNRAKLRKSCTWAWLGVSSDCRGGFPLSGPAAFFIFSYRASLLVSECVAFDGIAIFIISNITKAIFTWEGGT